MIWLCAPHPPPSSSREWKSYDQRQSAGRDSQHYFSLSLKLIFFIAESFLLLSSWIGFQGTLRIVVYRIHVFWKLVESRPLREKGENAVVTRSFFQRSALCANSPRPQCPRCGSTSSVAPAVFWPSSSYLEWVLWYFKKLFAYTKAMCVNEARGSALCWLVVSTWHKLESLGRREPQWENASLRRSIGRPLGCFLH